jgi:hypothetical protein
MTVFIKKKKKIKSKASKISDGNMKIDKIFFNNAFLGPFKIYIFRKFKKFNLPNQLKYLMGDFSKVNSHLKEQLLLKRFFYCICSKTGQ